MTTPAINAVREELLSRLVGLARTHSRRALRLQRLGLAAAEERKLARAFVDAARISKQTFARA